VNKAAAVVLLLSLITEADASECNTFAYGYTQGYGCGPSSNYGAAKRELDDEVDRYDRKVEQERQRDYDAFRSSIR
jgi:hypothetical protein